MPQRNGVKDFQLNLVIDDALVQELHLKKEKFRRNVKRKRITYLEVALDVTGLLN